MCPPPTPDGPFSETHLRIVMADACGNRGHFTDATRSGCFHCGAIFPASAIRYWVDVPEDVREDAPPEARLPRTAVCPYCDVDAVIADGEWTPVGPPLLAAAHARWFGSGQGPALRLTPGVEAPPRRERVPRAPGVVIPEAQRGLVDGARRLGEWLCTLPEASEDVRADIRTVLAEWAHLPVLTPGFRGRFECSVEDRRLERPLWRVWCVEIDELHDDVCIYGFAYDEERHDVVYAMQYESYHSWHRGIAEVDDDAAPGRWLADIAALPETRAFGARFEVDATVTHASPPREDT